MIAANSEKVLLKMLWEAIAANGRSPRVGISELVPEVEKFQNAGVQLYATTDRRGIEGAIRSDARSLALLGFVRFEGDAAELTGAGQLVASKLAYPRWAKRRVGREQAA